MPTVSETFTSTQRIVLGVIAAIMLSAGVALYAFFPAANPAVTAVLIRVGTVLGVVWLAFPQLKSAGQKVPGFIVCGLLGGLILMAARPNLFKVAAALIVLLIALSLLAKLLRKKE
jgi:Na+-translocating ferredoxin:NAD+ oxidoreductase RnfD subunit